MANELLTRDDIVRGKKNFDAQNAYMTGTAEEQVTLPDGQKIKTRAGFERELKESFGPESAASYKIGPLRGQVPLSEHVLEASNRLITGTVTNASSLCSNFSVGSRMLVSVTVTDTPPHFDRDQFFLVDTIASTSTSGSLLQIAIGHTSGNMFVRSSLLGSDFSSWRHTSRNVGTYTTTTATSANVVVTSEGGLQRSTSSKIFKKDIADITIPDYRAALKAVRPVSYRSTEATSDRTDWSWYSFIAEELAAIDPRLVQMDNIEFFEDTKEDGTTFINSRELPEGEYAANGINTNGIVALMVHINQQMLGDIEKLEDEKTQLKRRMTNLEKRMDAIDGPAAPAE